MSKFIHPTFAALAAVAISAAPSANALILTADTADVSIRATAAGDGSSTAGVVLESTTATNLQVGRGSGSQTSVGILVFQLPTLLPGETISAASLTFAQAPFTGVGSLAENIDLYGLRYSASATVTTDDFYVGASGGDATNASLLHDALLTKGVAYGNSDSTVDPAEFFTTSGGVGGSSIGLTTFLNAQYTAGAVGGDYVFLRFNMDTFSTGNRLDVISADNANINKPFIDVTITAVPEPSSAAALAGLGALGLVALRRRRQA